MVSHPDSAASLTEAGKQALAAGDYASARQAFETALPLQREALGPDHPDVADTHNHLGRINLESGDHAAGRRHFEAALDIRRRHFGEDHPEVANSLNNLGIQLREDGDFVGSMRCHEQALAIRLRVLGPSHGLVGYSLSNLGTTHRNLGDYIAARQSFERALPILEAGYGAGHFSVGACLTNLGMVLTQLGDYPAARDCHERALAIRRADQGENHPGIANALVNLGFTLIESGEAPAARPLFEQALAIFEHSLGPSNADVAACLTNLGEIAAELDARSAARDYFERALAMRGTVLGADHPEIAITLLSLAAIDRREQNFEQARRHLARALAIAGRPQGVAIRRLVWRGLSETEAAAGGNDAAIFFGKQAVNAIQRLRGELAAVEAGLQRSFAAANNRVFRHLAALLAAAGRLAEAERVIAMLKEEELFELLRRDAMADPRLSFVQLTALEARWQRRGDEIFEVIAKLDGTAADSTELQAARHKFEAWLDDVRAAFIAQDADHAGQIAALNREALAAVQAGLAAGVALVHYVPTDARLTIIVTTAGFQVSRDVEITDRLLNRLVHELRLAVEHQTNDLAILANRLERFLIAPIADVLARGGITMMMLAPVGALRYLPFAALHDGELYLVERFGLSLHTAAAPRGSASGASHTWRVGGFGVAGEHPGYRRLTMVADELAGIIADPAAGTTGVFPGRIFLDADFTEANFAASLGVHDAIHVASHFVLLPAQEWSSHLLLGDGSTLTLQRVRDADFQFAGIDLMGLSACETAMGGGQENGREVEGFGALVQTRGVRSVLATLWAVADDSTPALMAAFYRARHAGASKAQALRDAQCRMIAGPAAHRHPYFWGAFILMGDWQ
jgi:CHAT domain-containing protein/Tfp pilus assembly protein PilF